MNCRFCGNFVPEGKDSCPVCGRRPDEEPIGKLLSENQPSSNTLQTTDTAAAAAPQTVSVKKRPTGLFLPLLMIAVSAAGWVYGLMGNQKIFATLFASVFGTGTSMGDDSKYGTFAESGELTGLLLIGGAALLLTIIGVAGIIMLFKRLYNRAKY